MSETPRVWKYLERRPGSSYQQLCIKGKRIWAWTLYCEFLNEKEPRTPQQLAGCARSHGGRPSRARLSPRTRSAIFKADCICRVVADAPG
jgi:hypothetical protein